MLLRGCVHFLATVAWWNWLDGNDVHDEDIDDSDCSGGCDEDQADEDGDNLDTVCSNSQPVDRQISIISLAYCGYLQFSSDNLDVV